MQGRGQTNPVKCLAEGTFPVATTAQSDNGMIGLFDVERSDLYRYSITISASGLGANAFRQP